MKIGISGATGLIGRALCRRLAPLGHEITVFGRSRLPDLRFVEWNLLGQGPPPADLDGLDAFIHLAGKPVPAGLWSKRGREIVRQSRIAGTRRLVQALARCESRPQVLISASAVGYYGDTADSMVTEDSPSGEGFLADVCRAWEKEALEARELGLRVVLARTGVVLASDGGLLKQMLPSFRLGLGARLGSGGQFMSWIHIADEVALLDRALGDERWDGPFNLTAPNPVTNAEFSRQLARVLRRPQLLFVPAPLLRLAFGEMADALLLEGQRVLPERALALGYQFAFRQIEPALEDLLR
ncbi:MAG: TIGR01777 family oxidoreductase [Acidobacteriota bacterium]